MALISEQEIADAIASLEYSRRSEPIDYEEIRSRTVTALGKELTVAWAISLNLEGLKGKDGRFVKVGSKSQTYNEFLEALKDYNTKNNLSDTDSAVAATRVNISKKALTVSRVARAFAALVIQVLKIKIVSGSFPDFGTELPNEYRFLNSPYGMTDEELEAQKGNLKVWYTKWDAMIANAYKKGWAKSETGVTAGKRTWASAFTDYLQFRASNAAAASSE